MFLRWLFSSRTQDEISKSARSFRRKCAPFWKIWPIPQPDGEIHRVVFVDGIHIAKNVHILIASSEQYVLGWYLARSENSRSWTALLSLIPPPVVVVTDGGSGFEKARKKIWPETRVQRCVFHAFCQVKKETTTRPKLQAGVELYGLAKDLLRAKDIVSATQWITNYNTWCIRWEEFLSEKTYDEESHKWAWTHERLVRARNGLNTLLKRGHLFTFLEPDLLEDKPLPSTNNRLEGGINAPLRTMLRLHRGLSTMRRVKAVFWWCYMHTEHPVSAAELLRIMPTDDDIAELYQQSVYDPQKREGPQLWGDGLVWAELHHSVPWRIDWD